MFSTGDLVNVYQSNGPKRGIAVLFSGVIKEIRTNSTRTTLRYFVEPHPRPPSSTIVGAWVSVHVLEMVKEGFDADSYKAYDRAMGII